MPQIKINYKDEILKELSDISAEKAKQVLEFLCFIKHKEVLDRGNPDSYSNERSATHR